jgi:hypothetical protein
MAKQSKTAVKVFISYSHDSDAHDDRVLRLADSLREHGIDCDVDAYHDSPPSGWQLWMIRSIKRAKFVLVVCTKLYCRRFLGDQRGKGAVFEGLIITQQLYDEAPDNKKFIPVIFDPACRSHIPVTLRAATHYDLSSRGGYEKLYRRLTDRHSNPPPALGALKELPVRQDRRGSFALPPAAVSTAAPKRSTIAAVPVHEARANPSAKTKRRARARKSVATATGTAVVVLTINTDFDSFTGSDQTRLVRAISELMGMSTVTVIRTERGSVKLYLRVDADLARHLVAVVRAGELQGYGVVDAALQAEDGAATRGAAVRRRPPRLLHGRGSPISSPPYERQGHVFPYDAVTNKDTALGQGDGAIHVPFGTRMLVLSEVGEWGQVRLIGAGREGRMRVADYTATSGGGGAASLGLRAAAKPKSSKKASKKQQRKGRR